MVHMTVLLHIIFLLHPVTFPVVLYGYEIWSLTFKGGSWTEGF